jgi:hypothetical protein
MAVERLNARSAFAQQLDADQTATLALEPARQGVISWNTAASSGTIEFRILRAGAAASGWIPYVQWRADGAKSFSLDRDGVHVDVDVVAADRPFDGVEVRAEGVRFALVAFSSPVHLRASAPRPGRPIAVDVPQRSQYAGEERGWCSPASLTMVHAFYGLPGSVEETARAVFDRAYNGTGNWALNVAYSGARGLRGVVAYLPNFDAARRLLERGIPPVISYSWSEGELPNAPLLHSDGHLAVLCGFDDAGDCIVNDPAAPDVRVTYPYGALEPLWQRAGGVAYVVAPKTVEYADLLCGA